MSKQTISEGVVHRLPPDLKKALTADKAALAKWEDITPLARNEWICRVESVKTPEIREQHKDSESESISPHRRLACPLDEHPLALEWLERTKGPGGNRRP
jgi:hypothetical protein